MRAGRHYAEFSLKKWQGSPDYQGRDTRVPNWLGVIRPGFDVEGVHDPMPQETEGHCFIGPGGQRAFVRDDEIVDGLVWSGSWGVVADELVESRIGMLLDFETGSMTVFRNDERLGVMETGLAGEYCWAASLLYEGTAVRIDSRPAPSPPTAEEVAAAQAKNEELEAETLARWAALSSEEEFSSEDDDEP